MVANVWQVRCGVGDVVEAGAELVILESMKMEIPVRAPGPGRITAVHVAPDDVVQEGDVLVELR